MTAEGPDTPTSIAMGLKKADKVEVTVVPAVELDPPFSHALPASPDIAKRRRSFSFLRAKSWRTWQGTAREDVKSMRWLMGLMWTGIVLWTLALVAAIVSLSTLAAASSTLKTPRFIAYFLDIFNLRSILWALSDLSSRGGSACQPNGSFSIYPDSYEWWTMGDFFEITIGFRSLSFTEAKLIDVAASIILGRLGQGIVGYVSWRVFADYLTISMAARPATYTTFWVVFLHREPSLAAWVRLLREFWRGGVLNSRTAMTFMSLTMLFVLSIPTLMNSMTGYTPMSAAFIRTDDYKLSQALQLANSTTPIRSGPQTLPGASQSVFWGFQEVIYIIHDGARVGLTDEHPVPSPNGQWTGGIGEPLVSHYDLPWMCRNCTSQSPPKGEDCVRANVSSYVQKHGFYGLDNISSTFMGVELPPPVLNVSVSYIPGNRMSAWSRDFPAWSPNSTILDNCWGISWADPRTGYQPARDAHNRHYIDPLQRTYSLEHIQSSGVCQPAIQQCPYSDDPLCTVQKYLWGFSYIQLFLNTLLYLIWTIGLHIMWLKSQAQLPLKGTPEVPRGWRALIHLGETIRKDLDRRGIDPEKLTDRQLKTEIRKQLHGGSVEFGETLRYPGRGFWAAFQSWCRREKNKAFLWWSVGIGVGALIFNLIGFGADSGDKWILKSITATCGYILSFVFVGMLWAMSLGRTTTSRVVFILIWGVVIPAAWFGIRMRA
ncbi:hypothetical protein B0T14DRAFT_455773 [Immersiella caudata]|uniref:Uncharacterized protein n=1 Tax=Immersiella caudata TaxID=314043 RepID=A0AA39WQ09_9PEZI|nr:hypothetical protein B0T14DRAFT_455773 [Immersiella caudata]